MYTINEWFLKCKVRQTEIFVILGKFLPFQPPDNPENQNVKIEKITWRHYHFTHLYHTWQSYDVCFLRYGIWRTEFFVIFGILYRCTINDNYMMYGSCDMERVGQNFLSFWTILCPFTPLKTWKTKILKNWKKYQEISSFYNGVPKSWSYAILFLIYGA